ncbi:hypothetical protein V5O48_018363 [Marasmius crinis-equi]|uniref:SWIM-type domain-containing protein n=1 Tax=Marasmius crinis-equi TaxID=585013 RepID=A0ABR3ELD8_9AGAR
MAQGRCSSSRCKKELPENYTFKTCETCRAASRKSMQNRAAQKRAWEEEHPPHRPAPCPPSDTQPPSCTTRPADDSDTDDEEATTSSYKLFNSAEELFKEMKAVYKRPKGCGGRFSAKYSLPLDSEIMHHDRVKMSARDVWQASTYRFTVRDNRKLKNGHKTRYWCSQDKDHKQKSRPSQDPKAIHRTNLGMKRFSCRSRLTITARTVADHVEISIRMEHHEAHLVYVDVAIPVATVEYITDHLEFKPHDLFKALRTEHNTLTSDQVYSAWLRLSEVLWRRDDNQMVSARKLLKELETAGEVDVFNTVSVDGIEQLAWGMKKLAKELTGIGVVEIGIDATFNTNSKGLELYGVLGEYDGGGYPLAYCLLSTAQSTVIKKRILALEPFTVQLRDKYGIKPRHYHVDKDMAEIRVAQKVWPNANISLCQWHFNRAIEDRLKKSKLSTTPYDPIRAHTEFTFIDIKFRPTGPADPNEFEGGNVHAESQPLSPPPPPTQNPNALLICIQPRGTPANNGATPPVRFACSQAKKIDDENDDEIEGKRVFCRRHLRQPILDMMNQHYCAHPMIPGYSAPTPEGIRYWAVKEIYQYCSQNDLCETWAYLWENWYCTGRWELWARCSNPKEIPRLKTTMILESHWKHLKHDYLDHFSNPRIDFLIWTVVMKAGRAFLGTLQNISVDNGRWTHRSSWRKPFKREWQRCAVTPITLPLNPKYRPNPSRWTCTCPYFVSSRFFLCKHLVQSVQEVEPVFFWEVERNRTAPWYVHPSLRPLDPTLPPIVSIPASDLPDVRAVDEEDPADNPIPTDGDSEEGDEDETAVGDTRSFESHLDSRIELLSEFLAGLKFNRQFRDHRLLEVVERRGRSFFKMADEWLEKERQMNSTRCARPNTWSSGDAMFYRPRPPAAEREGNGS